MENCGDCSDEDVNGNIKTGTTIKSTKSEEPKQPADYTQITVL